MCFQCPSLSTTYTNLWAIYWNCEPTLKPGGANWPGIPLQAIGQSCEKSHQPKDYDQRRLKYLKTIQNNSSQQSNKIRMRMEDYFLYFKRAALVKALSDNITSRKNDLNKCLQMNAGIAFITDSICFIHGEEHQSTKWCRAASKSSFLAQKNKWTLDFTVKGIVYKTLFSLFVMTPSKSPCFWWMRKFHQYLILIFILQWLLYCDFSHNDAFHFIWQ